MKAHGRSSRQIFLAIYRGRMKLTGITLRAVWPGLLLFILALCCPPFSQAQAARERVLSATGLLEKRLQSLKLSDEERGQRAALLSSIRQNLEAGQLYLGLYRLQSVWAEVAAQDYAASKAELQQQGTAAFEKEWQRLGLELSEKEKRLATTLSGRPSAAAAALVALAETSLTQVRPYYQSGRLYGLNTTIRDGLYYMGLAPALLDFAILCRELSLEGQGKPLKLRSLKQELVKLEALVVDSYRRLDSSDSQPQFIRLNSTLKMAVELDGEGRYAGALLKYLEATLLLNLLSAPQMSAQDLPRLNQESRLMESRLKSAGDNSIALIYLEMARGAIEEGARGRPDAERLKRAAVIIDRVLPRYFEIVGVEK